MFAQLETHNSPNAVCDGRLSDIAPSNALFRMVGSVSPAACRYSSCSAALYLDCPDPISTQISDHYCIREIVFPGGGLVIGETNKRDLMPHLIGVRNPRHTWWLLSQNRTNAMFIAAIAAQEIERGEFAAVSSRAHRDGGQADVG